MAANNDPQPTSTRPAGHWHLRSIIKETTAGGIVWQVGQGGQIEILVIEDAKGRWTLPKGHVEPGETYRQTARREISEETGLKKLEVGPAVKPVNFQYRRGGDLVVMTLHLFVIRSLDREAMIKKEDWMRSIAWMSANQAIEQIEYEDICRAVLVGLRHIRTNIARQP